MRVYIIPPTGGHHPMDIADGNTLRSLQFLVDGYIEPCAPPDLRGQGIELLANEEGLLRKLPINWNMLPFFFVGVLVAVGIGEDDFISLTPEQEAYLKKWLEGLK